MPSPLNKNYIIENAASLNKYQHSRRKGQSLILEIAEKDGSIYPGGGEVKLGRTGEEVLPSVMDVWIFSRITHIHFILT